MRILAFALLAAPSLSATPAADLQASSSSLPDLSELVPAQKAGLPPGPPMLSGVGMGLQAGFPSALTLKIGKAHDNGLAFGIGAGFGYRNFLPSLSLHGDYQLHLATLVRTGDLALTAYVGPGLWLALFGTGYGVFNQPVYAPITFFGVGVRMSLGLSMALSMAPLELYLELTPTVFVFPALDPGLGWSLGFRYYF